MRPSFNREREGELMAGLAGIIALALAIVLGLWFAKKLKVL